MTMFSKHFGGGIAPLFPLATPMHHSDIMVSWWCHMPNFLMITS